MPDKFDRDAAMLDLMDRLDRLTPAEFEEGYGMIVEYIIEALHNPTYAFVDIQSTVH